MVRKLSGSGSYKDIAQIDRLRDELWTYGQFRKDAFHIADKIGWEGDISQGPFITGVAASDGGDSQIIMAWKQSNDGATFIISPNKLQYLEREALDYLGV